MEPPVDFAIITALKVEREAVVRRLEDVRKVQLDGEPLTFYTGVVPISGEDRPFTVVVTQLLEMGNVDAGIATTRVIRHWRPRNVLMVGIAGGVPGKAELGDVVVAQYSYYYEPAKLAADGVEHRGRQFSCDLMLLGRAMHYDAADWKRDIGTPRPDDVAEEHDHPAVRFGPIACGEKVVANLTALEEIIQQCPKTVAVAMEGAAVAKGLLIDQPPPAFLEIRAISDDASPKKDDRWHEYAANAAAAFAIGFLRSRPVAPGSGAERRAGQPARPAATLVLLAESLRSVAADEVLPALDEEARQGELEVLPLDFTDLVRNKVFTDPEGAVRRLADPQSALVGALARRADARLVFHGLCAIPPVMLAGHVVTDRRYVRLYDFHPEAGSWTWPGAPDGWPALERSRMPKRTVRGTGDAVVRMPVSYAINRVDTDALQLGARVQIDLSSPEPTRGIVRCEEQVREYGRLFRQTLDELTRVMPGCRRIHLFYAGPMALAFHIGQQISENIHPPVVVWNYSRGYDWAINLAAAVSGEPCIVRPDAVHSGGNS